MICSVSISIFAVASSISTIFVFLSIALAIQISCLSPALKFSPPSLISESSPYSLFCNRLSKQHYLSALIISSSVDFYNGSMFYLRVPSNIVASYIIIVIDDLTYFKDSKEISTPSINNLPEKPSKTLNRVKLMVDFPAPVLPTTPIFYLG